MAGLRRSFLDTSVGQLHVVRADSDSDRSPLVLLPQLSAMELTRLMERIGDRPVIAIDPPGCGASDPPQGEHPTVTDIATAVLLALNELGMERVDLYGSHQGARVATEVAVLEPMRVGHLVLDGAGYMDEARSAELARDYAPPAAIDHHGSQLRWSWHFVRDAFLFWPHHEKSATNARTVGLPEAEILHERVVDVLKNARSIHKNMRAIFEYPTHDRLPKVQCPTLLSGPDGHCAPLLTQSTETGLDFYDAALSSDEEVLAWASAITKFLDR